MRVAELVARDERYEQEAHDERDHEHPHQRVAVVAARHPHVHHVARAQPGEHDHETGAEGAYVLEEGPRNGRGSDLRGHLPCRHRSSATATTMIDAGHDLLHPVGQAQLRAAVLDHGHEGRADQRAEDGALAAGEAAAADDDGGDDVELQADGGGGIADGEVGELQHAREAGERGRRACRPRPWCGSTATPHRRAVRSFEPIANTCRPKRV